MSYNIDGKIVNQFIRFNISNKNQVKCSCCSKLIPFPERQLIPIISTKQSLSIHHYIGTPYFIYETKSGTPVAYCSDKCRRKHNHRFNNEG